MTKIVFLLFLLCLSARSSHAQGTVVIGTSCSPSGLSSIGSTGVAVQCQVSLERAMGIEPTSEVRGAILNRGGDSFGECIAPDGIVFEPHFSGKHRSVSRDKRSLDPDSLRDAKRESMRP
jgi:hypothetical protein